jgi:hypothetical protein
MNEESATPNVGVALEKRGLWGVKIRNNNRCVG